MASINIKKTPTANVSNPPSGSTSLYVNASGDLSLKDENGKTVTIGGYKVSNSVYPTGAYFSRVLEDSGNIKDLNHLTELYIKNLSLLDSTVFLWNGEAGTKRRTSGSNTFASKLYNMANKVQQFGAEKVLNGTFTTNTDNWTPFSGAILSVDTNRLKVTGNAAAAAYQIISVEKDKTYHVGFTQIIGSCNLNFYIGKTASSAEYGTYVTSVNQTKTVSFKADATGNVYIVLRLSSGTLETDYGFFDNISVRQMDWIEGTNDAVQTTEANQPYVGGLIAPNEVGRVKHNGYNGTNVKKLATNLFTIAGNSPVTAIYVLKLNKGGAIVQIIDGTMVSSGLRLGVNESRLLSTSYLPTGTNVIVEFRSDGIGNGAVKINGVKQPITHNGGNSVSFSGISEDSSNPAFSFDGELIHKQIFNKALSESESQAVHDFLRLQIPEIEGVAIGNQYWATSNYEGVAAGDGSVIPEVQNSDNVEKITNAADREFSSDTGFWTKSAYVTIADGVAHFIESPAYPGSGLSRTSLGTPLKWNKITFTIKNYVKGSLYLNLSNTNYGVGLYNSNGTYSFYWYGSGLAPVLISTSELSTFDVDDISVEEVGWSQSTALYDAIYAQTSGTAAVKELAALKAAAMWCYYNNDVNNGAIYGKMYNWYAVKLISLYPPQGWRVPTFADFTQLQTYLGGSTIAGGKMKALYGGFNNAFSTNESGFSAIAGGFRNANSNFYELSETAIFYDSAANGIISYAPNTTLVIYNFSDLRFGFYLRLLRNSPVGPNEKTITSTTIVSDIASTANSTQIPFGYSVASIRLKTTANLTNIKVELWNNFYSGTPTLVSTLITGKTANNTTMVFPVLADAAALLQDGNLRVTATGASGYETVLEYNLQKNTF